MAHLSNREGSRNRQTIPWSALDVWSAAATLNHRVITCQSDKSRNVLHSRQRFGRIKPLAFPDIWIEANGR
jgi:hypothetical protein